MSQGEQAGVAKAAGERQGSSAGQSRNGRGEGPCREFQSEPHLAVLSQLTIRLSTRLSWATLPLESHRTYFTLTTRSYVLIHMGSILRIEKCFCECVLCINYYKYIKILPIEKSETKPNFTHLTFNVFERGGHAISERAET